ncbi:hypothetical protein Syun_018309 [Stephania yunnanensis]|uniref:RING-type domain-containing protein n=1 Tax=Stephania yunnanensis TaxID=152371 RepID=A0AAP0ITX3_9MAGN
MGITVRDKHHRTNHRKQRAMKSDTSNNNSGDSLVEKSGNPNSLNELNLKPLDDFGDRERNPNLNPGFDESGWDYCTEDQLEELLLKNLEFLYNEAVSKLIGLGYDDEFALQAILRYGNCCGSMDVLTNILQNTLGYLNSHSADLDEQEMYFGDLRQLEQYSLGTLVRLLQQYRPHLSRGEAMWCLLMSDLHVGRASTMEIPMPPSSGNVGSSTMENGESGSHSSIGVSPEICKFHGGWGFAGGETCEFAMSGPFSLPFDAALLRDVECPKRFNLTPSLKSLLQRNVTMFAAGFRANTKAVMAQSQAFPNPLFSGESQIGINLGSEAPPEKYEECGDSQSSDMVSNVLSSLNNLSIDEKHEGGVMDQKSEAILNMVNQIRELEAQVKERKDWAQQKAMQAARRLSNDLTELKVLRLEREEIQRIKKGKQALEESNTKKLAELDNAFRKASTQVDNANNELRDLETANAEIRAEMEASKLSASESVNACLEVAKREKKCLKRLLAWEKQKAKLQEEVAQEKQKIAQLQRQLVLVKESHKETEVSWRQEIKVKEEAISQVDEERRLKEADEASAKRRQESLRRKIEIDFQRHKDDIQRLEQELARLKASMDSTQLNSQTNASCTGQVETTVIHSEPNARMLHELYKLQDSADKEVDYDRECLVCFKDEVSVVFLPCAHQVLCANCDEGYCQKGRATCPCCQMQIEQRIRVFGASS